MLTRLLPIYLISIIFLYFITSIDVSSYKYKTPKWVQGKYKSISKKFSNKEYARLLTSYVTGAKVRIKKEIKNAHKETTCMHLFTPSGVHFSAFLCMLYPLILFISKLSKNLATFITLSINCFPFFLDGMFSLKRIAIMRFFHFFLKKKILDLNFFNFINKHALILSFYLTFVIDFFIGSYQASPFSFTYSFLFLGTIISCVERQKRSPVNIFFGILGGQIIVSCMTGQAVTLVGVMLGFLLTNIFTILFPIFVIYFFFHNFLPESIIEFLMRVFVELMQWCANLSLKTSPLPNDFFMLLIVIVSTLQIDKLKKLWIIFFLLLLTMKSTTDLPGIYGA